MQFILTFIEGLMAFISPCVLPLLPMYIFYFAGNGGDNADDSDASDASEKNAAIPTTDGSKDKSKTCEIINAKKNVDVISEAEKTAADTLITADTVKNEADILEDEKHEADTAISVGDEKNETRINDRSTRKTANKTAVAVINSLGFVGGFTIIFVLLGVFAGSVGMWLVRYRTAVNIVAGSIVVLFGLYYGGIIKIKFLNRTVKPEAKFRPDGFFKAVLFGVVFAVGWSPCTGAFLGSALMLAATSQSRITGMLLLGAYSLGLGLPFVICAALIEKLKGFFKAIKKHYKTVNLVSGLLLVATGIMMMFGLMTKLAGLFT